MERERDGSADAYPHCTLRNSRESRICLGGSDRRPSAINEVERSPHDDDIDVSYRFNPSRNFQNLCISLVPYISEPLLEFWRNPADRITHKPNQSHNLFASHR